MRKLYVAATEACRSAFECEREVIDFDNANFTEVSIAVMTAEEAKAGKLERVESTAFGIPVVILNECGEVDPTLIGRADSIIDCKADDAKLYGRQIDTLARIAMPTPTTVTMGTAALRSAWPSSTCISVMPLARAVRMKSSVSISATDARVTRAMSAT